MANPAQMQALPPPSEGRRPADTFGAATEWLNAFGQFLLDNIGLTLLALWCFSIFAMTEFAKPFLRRFLKDKADAALVTKAYPQAIGALTGYWVFPAIMSTTKWGATLTVPGFLGVGAGFLFGLVTIGVYELARNKRVTRFFKILITKAIGLLPFMKLSKKDLEYIDRTTGSATITAEMVEEFQRLQRERAARNPSPPAGVLLPSEGATPTPPPDEPEDGDRLDTPDATEQ